MFYEKKISELCFIARSLQCSLCYILCNQVKNADMNIQLQFFAVPSMAEGTCKYCHIWYEPLHVSAWRSALPGSIGAPIVPCSKLGDGVNIFVSYESSGPPSFSQEKTRNKLSMKLLKVGAGSISRIMSLHSLCLK